MIERVKRAIDDFKDIQYSELVVDTQEKAKEYKFRGSPTLLIVGKDFENEPEANPALSCRYYPNSLPEIEEIKKRISSL